MDLEDLRPSVEVWQAELNLSVQSSRPHQSRVQCVRSVGGHEHLDVSSRLEPVKLVDNFEHSSLHLVIAASAIIKPGSSTEAIHFAGTQLVSEPAAAVMDSRHSASVGAPAVQGRGTQIVCVCGGALNAKGPGECRQKCHEGVHGIDFVEEDDAGFLGLRHLEQLSHHSGSFSHVFLHQLTANDSDEARISSVGNGSGRQGFSGTWRPVEQNALGGIDSQLNELFWVQERHLNDLSTRAKSIQQVILREPLHSDTNPFSSLRRVRRSKRKKKKTHQLRLLGGSAAEDLSGEGGS